MVDGSPIAIGCDLTAVSDCDLEEDVTLSAALEGEHGERSERVALALSRADLRAWATASALWREGVRPVADLRLIAETQPSRNDIPSLMAMSRTERRAKLELLAALQGVEIAECGPADLDAFCIEDAGVAVDLSMRCVH